MSKTDKGGLQRIPPFSYLPRGLNIMCHGLFKQAFKTELLIVLWLPKEA